MPNVNIPYGVALMSDILEEISVLSNNLQLYNFTEKPANF
jgi:hypothetical protein